MKPAVLNLVRGAGVLAACLMALLYAQAAGAQTSADMGGSPLFEQRLYEMGLQFEGKIGADQRERSGIGEEQAFFFPSEAVSACAGSACVASGCGASACAGSACTGSACGGSGCAGSACGGSLCGGSICGASVCGGSGCAGSACGASGCVGSACGQSGCVGSACRQSGCVGSACNGCSGQNNGAPGIQFAQIGDGDVVQSACPFNRETDNGVLQISGFEVAHQGDTVAITWIVAGGPVANFRVLRDLDGTRSVVSEGKLQAYVMQTVSDRVPAPNARYIVEVVDAFGWIVSVTSDGEMTRRAEGRRTAPDSELIAALLAR